MFHVLPQESTLGPLLFVIYINDFTQSINLCKVVLYADDTILLFANKDPDIIKHTLQSDHSAQHWFNCNKLNQHVSKCKWIMFGTVQRLRRTKATDLFLTYLKWQLLTKHKAYHTHIFMFKCLNGLAQNYLSRNFKYVNHCYYTKYQDKHVLYVSKAKLEITKSTLAHHGTINWNTLPDYCKSARH